MGRGRRKREEKGKEKGIRKGEGERANRKGKGNGRRKGGRGRRQHRPHPSRHTRYAVKAEGARAAREKATKNGAGMPPFKVPRRRRSRSAAAAAVFRDPGPAVGLLARRGQGIGRPRRP